MGNKMVHPRKFFLIVNRFGDIIEYRDEHWKPADVSPYTVLFWTGVTFVEYKT